MPAGRNEQPVQIALLRTPAGRNENPVQIALLRTPAERNEDHVRIPLFLRGSARRNPRAIVSIVDPEIFDLGLVCCRWWLCCLRDEEHSYFDQLWRRNCSRVGSKQTAKSLGTRKHEAYRMLKSTSPWSLSPAVALNGRLKREFSQLSADQDAQVLIVCNKSLCNLQNFDPATHQNCVNILIL